MEICTYGLDSHLSKYNISAISNRKPIIKSTFTFKNLNYDRNFSSVNGVCFASFFEESIRELVK